MRAIRQYFIRQKLHSVMSSLLRNHSLCTMLQLDAPVYSSACSLPLKAAQGDVASNCPKSLYTEGKRGLVCQPEEIDPNDVYTVTVKTDGTKTVQSKRYSDLLSFQLHLILDFVLTQRKLAHSPVKFPARLISHFAMNIILAKTGSTAKVNSAK